MRTSVRAAVVTAAALSFAAAGSGLAAAQPAPPEPPPNPADEAAQLACVQRYLDLTTLPQQALLDPVTFSLRVAEAARQCENVRAPAPPGAPSTLPAG